MKPDKLIKPMRTPQTNIKEMPSFIESHIYCKATICWFQFAIMGINSHIF
jgi:hypothetical protein